MVESKIRNSNFEMLRIIAMLMIIGHHYIYYGVMQNYDPQVANNIYSTGLLFNKLWSQLLLPGGVVGVNIFFLIMGYFGISSNRIKIKSIVIDTLLYSLFGFVIYYVFVFLGLTSSTSITQKLSYLIPVSSQVYWFVSVYIIISLMKPTINKYIKAVKQNRVLTVLLLVIIYFFLTRRNVSEYMGLVRGLVLYFVGAEIFLNKEKLISAKLKVLYLLLFVVSWGVYIVLRKFPTIDMCVVGTLIPVLMVLYAISCKQFYSPIINMIAASTFSVYLVHENPLMREMLWSRLFHVETIQYQSVLFVALSIGTIICVFFLGFIIDCIKKKLIDKEFDYFITKAKTVVFKTDKDGSEYRSS